MMPKVYVPFDFTSYHVRIQYISYSLSNRLLIFAFLLKQAFAHVIFDNTAHDNATFDSFEVNLPRGDEEVAFKMNIKPICSIMKNFKKVKSLVIFTETNGDIGRNQIVFEMTNEASMKRTHKFHYQDTEIINAYFDEKMASNLTVAPKVLHNNT